MSSCHNTMTKPSRSVWVLLAFFVSASGQVHDTFYSKTGQYEAPYLGNSFLEEGTVLSCGFHCLSQPNCVRFGYSGTKKLCLTTVPSCSNGTSATEATVVLDCYVQVYYL